MAGGAVAIASFLPDVTENLVSDQPGLRGRYGKERLMGRRGGVGRVWWSDGCEGCGGGLEKLRKINATPLLSRGGS